jgi:putative protease
LALSYDESELPAGLAAHTENGSLAKFKQKNKICVGDAAELLTPGMIGQPFTVREIYNAEGEAVASAPHPSQIVYIRVPFPVGEGDILRAGDDEGKEESR